MIDLLAQLNDAWASSQDGTPLGAIGAGAAMFAYLWWTILGDGDLR